MPGQFYRAPIDPGYDRGPVVGLMQGVANGLGAYYQGQDRRRALDEHEEDRRLQRQLQEAELGPVLGEDAAYETVPGAVTHRVNPSMAAVAAGPRPGERAQDWLGQLPEAVHTEVEPAQRRLRPNVAQIGDQFRDLSQGLGARRAAANAVAAREAEAQERTRKYSDALMAATAAGYPADRARDAAMHAAYGLPYRESPDEVADRVRASESAREPYREADDKRARDRAVELRAMIEAGSGGGGRAATRASQTAARRNARETAERLLRENRTWSTGQVINYLADQGRGFRDDLQLDEIRNIASDAEASVRGTRTRQGRTTPPPAAGGAGRGTGAASGTITAAELRALLANPPRNPATGRPYTEAEIRARYTVR